MVAAGVWIANGVASAGTLSGTLYKDPNSAVVKWVAANSGDSRMPVIRDKIASQPAARWVANYNPSTVQSETSAYISAANSAGQIPLLSVYEIPNRDCGGASAGGAPDLGSYQSWVSNFAAGLGNQTVIIILETDSLALQTCLSASEVTARGNAISQAVQTIKSRNGNAKVYLDGGHSAWNSASEQANRLRGAGVQYADGFYTNVSNFNPTSAEASYGASIISALNGMGISGKRQIIDTSRNGGASGDWCGDDNTDRRIGQYPTLNTGNANIDGYLWIKPPGEADGCSFTAGSFQAALAYSLAQSAPYPSSQAPVSSAAITTRPASSAPVTTSAAVTTRPATSGPVTPTYPITTTPAVTTGAPGSCSATYKLVSSWGGGYQAEITVKAGASAINGWTVTINGQTISQLWNGTLTTSGSTATVKNLSWNGSLPAGGTASFGYLGNGTASTPQLTCTSP
jgi:endoglucanase